MTFSAILSLLDSIRLVSYSSIASCHLNNSPVQYRTDGDSESGMFLNANGT